MSVKRFMQKPGRLYLGQCVVFLIALLVIFASLSPFFLSIGNFATILTASSVIGVIAIGATFVIAAGGIDLSSAAVMGLAGTICAYGLQKLALPAVAAIPLAIAAAGLCGFTTGLLINVTRAPSFIISLGMMSIARACAFIIAKGMPIYGLPDNVIDAGQGHIAGIPVPVAILLAAIALAALLLSKTRFGAQTIIMGDNLFAAQAMGIPIRLRRLQIFTLAGLYSGVAGVVFMLRTNAGDPSAGQSYELVAITAVILGGANLFGGRAAIGGTVLGVLCLGMLQNGLNLLAVSAYFQTLFIGLVLLAAAFLSRIGRQR